MKYLILQLFFIIFNPSIKYVENHSFSFLSSEVLILPLSHQNFSLPSPDIKYRPSLLDMPDLPSWLHYTYSAAVHSGFIYGAPPSGITELKLEVVATDKHTFNISRRVYDLNIKQQNSKENEVHFKITNMNIDELLVGSRWEKLKSILIGDLWPSSQSDGVFTSLTPASLMGDKLPLNPNDKEGVYIGYGSSVPFSDSLTELQEEVKPLYRHKPCPRYFKISSKERFFRQKGFALDWCNFKLVKNSDENFKSGKERNAAMKAAMQYTPVKLIKKSEVKSRSYVFDVIYMILIPLLVMLVLLGLLTLAMCCHRDNILPSKQSIQMVQYAGINKAAGAIRSIKHRRDAREQSAPPSLNTTTTHIDTLPRGTVTTPDSSRRFEDYATLTRPNPPPYQRRSSTPSRLV